MLQIAPLTRRVIRFALALLLIALPYQLAKADENPPVIVVTGQAEMQLVPDEAQVVFVFEARADTTEDAVKHMSKASDSFIAKLQHRLDIPKDKVATESLSVSPTYEQVPCGNRMCQGKEIDFATASIRIRIESLPIASLAQVMDLAFSEGAARVQELTLSRSDADRYENQLLAIASKQAKAKAQSIAQALEVTLGAPVRVQQQGPSMPRKMLQHGEISAFSAMGKRASSSLAPNVSPGQITLTTSVVVEFEIED